MNHLYSEKSVLSSWAKETLDLIEQAESKPKPKQFLYHTPDWMAGIMSDSQVKIMAQQKQSELQPLIDMLESCSIKSIVHAAYEMFGTEVSGFVKLCVSHQAGLDEAGVGEIKEPEDPEPLSAIEPEEEAKELSYPEQGAIESLLDDDGKPDTPALPQNGS